MGSPRFSRSSNTALSISVLARVIGTPVAHPRSILFIILAGMALRINLIKQFPLREDEAVYGTWALHFLREDPLFLTLWPDKPPLYIWSLSGTFALFGVTEWSARWLNVAISTLTIPLVAQIARRIWGDSAALFATAAVALNPYAISFAPTAYTDPLLLLTGALALYAALAAAPFRAGIGLGLALMTKQHGLLFLPLIVGVLAQQQGKQQNMGKRGAPSLWLSAALGAGMITLPIVFWDSLRWGVAPSPWDLGARNYRVLTVLPPPLWLDRLRDWSVWLRYLVGFEWMVACVLTGLSLAFLGKAHLRFRLLFSVHEWMRRSSAAWLTVLLLLWLAGFITLHVVISVEIWDRYLLSALLPLALLTGGLAGALYERVSPVGQRLLLNLWIVFLIPAALQASRAHIPVGGDHGALTGLHEALDWLGTENDRTPYILYHHHLGAQYRFYLHEQQAEGQVELLWYPHAVYLFDNAAKAPHRRKFLLLPSWSSPRNFEVQAAVRRIDVRARTQAGRFHVVELIPRPPGHCDWCVCEKPSGWTKLSFFGEMACVGIKNERGEACSDYGPCPPESFTTRNAAPKLPQTEAPPELSCAPPRLYECEPLAFPRSPLQP